MDVRHVHIAHADGDDMLVRRAVDVLATVTQDDLDHSVSVFVHSDQLARCALALRELGSLGGRAAALARGGNIATALTIALCDSRLHLEDALADLRRRLALEEARDALADQAVDQALRWGG